MPDKKEKMILLYLCEVCKSKNTCLILAENIAKYVSKKYLISLRELGMIMEFLKKQEYIDFVLSDSKNGACYCVTLKSKAKTYKQDIKQQKRVFVGLLGRTVILTVVSFVLGVLLKMIFN